VEEETMRNWERDPDDRCPVCFVPPGVWHLPGECIYSGLWRGPKALPDVAARGDSPSDEGSPGGTHDVCGGESDS
jgi:hypothetical protein